MSLVISNLGYRWSVKLKSKVKDEKGGSSVKSTLYFGTCEP